ncbi:MAG: biotin/lipoyl-binding protein, partial [Hyphomicrobium sp.]
MTRKSTIKIAGSLIALSLAAGAGALGTMGYADTLIASPNTDDASPAKPRAPELAWIAAAPGRVEPKSGLVRVGAGLLGRIADVSVKVNDKVEEGELLIRLDDEEA